MKKIIVILMILCCALPSLAKVSHNEEIITPLTQLEKRMFQTRTYNTQDNILAMKSILNVLQDEGFIVYNVNTLLGFIYGVKDFDMKDPNVDISKEFGITKSRLSYNGVNVATLEVSVNVTPYGEKSRIRANFKRKLLNQYGNAQMINDIDEAEFYDEFFAKVDKALNMQKEIQIKLTPEIKSNQDTKETESVITKTQIKQENEQKTKIVESEDISQTTETDENKFTNTENETVTETVTNDVSDVRSDETTPNDSENLTPNQESKDVTFDDATEKSVNSEKELKKLIKQAKEEAKQAQKEAKEAAKEARRLEKEAIRVQKESNKEMGKEENQQSEKDLTE